MADTVVLLPVISQDECPASGDGPHRSYRKDRTCCFCGEQIPEPPVLIRDAVSDTVLRIRSALVDAGHPEHEGPRDDLLELLRYIAHVEAQRDQAEASLERIISG